MSLSQPALIGTDAALPQRDALLDVKTIADRIGHLIHAAGPVAIGRCERLRVNYQVGKSLRVLHQVEVAGSTRTISARAFREGRGEDACREARAAAPSCDGLSPVFYDDGLNAAFWVFPHDRKIAGLAAIANGEVSRRDRLPCAWTSTRLMAYAPEKSATLACLDDDGAIVAYAKASAHDQTRHDCERYRALGESLGRSPHLRLPRPLAYVPRHRLLVVEAIAGRRMDDPGVGAQAIEDATRFGAALATFHELAHAGVPTFTRFAPPRLIEAGRLVAMVRADVEESVSALARELIARQPDEPDAAVCLHGDVHPKNAIVTDPGVALIDMEDVATGPPAADLGSFLAALLYLRRGGRFGDDTCDAVARSFFGGYGSIRPLPSRTALGWHTAAALLIERILRAVTRVRPLGLLHLPELLGDARAVMADGPRP
jgi:Phosphotransferase enzyme family